MNKDNIEKRYYEGEIVKPDDTSRHVEGYALVFDSRSVDLGFYETIERGAISQEMVDNCDVFALLNHDEDKVLARSNSSLKLTVDERGLKYEFDAPHTSLGDELLEHISRGEIDSSSFAFVVDWNDKEAQTWERRDGVTYRTIKKIDYISDVSPVYRAAYSATSVSKRAKDEAKQIVEAEQKALEEARCKEINDKLDALTREIDEIAKI